MPTQNLAGSKEVYLMPLLGPFTTELELKLIPTRMIKKRCFGSVCARVRSTEVNNRALPSGGVARFDSFSKRHALANAEQGMTSLPANDATVAFCQSKTEG